MLKSYFASIISVRSTYLWENPNPDPVRVRILPLANGSGSGSCRPNNMRIFRVRIQILNTARKLKCSHLCCSFFSEKSWFLHILAMLVHRCRQTTRIWSTMWRTTSTGSGWPPVLQIRPSRWAGWSSCSSWKKRKLFIFLPEWTGTALLSYQ